MSDQKRIERLVLCTPATDLRLQETAKGPAWAVGKPGKFRAWTGPVEVTDEKLRIMAESYDPELDRAPINYDHDGYGPALGWIGSVFFEDGILWAVPSEISEEAAEEIKAGRRRRVSMEISKDHQITGDWYLDGLALLGAAKPAIRGLPEIALSSGDALLIQLSDDEPGEPAGDPETSPAGAEKEATMADKNMTQPAAGDPQPPTKNDDSVELKADREQLAADRKALAEERKATREERLAARRERVTLQVEKDLEGLGSRVTPGMLRQGLKAAMIELKAAEVPASIKLSQKDGEETREVDTPVYDVVLGALQQLPEFTALGQGEIASSDDGAKLAGDTRSAEQRATDRRMGISDERAVELAQRAN